MTLPYFVVDTKALQSDRVELGGDEGRHAVVVRRIRPGERIVLTDGRGRRAACVVQTTSKSGLVASVELRHVEPAPQPRLVVVQAIPKGEHAERAVDLLTEVGADVIVPWAASRNVVTWKGDRGDKSLARWRATALSAAKQARRSWIPTITDLHGTAEVCSLLRGSAVSLVLHERADMPSTEAVVPSRGDLVVVVGPEGGITDEELAAFTSTGAQPARLGPTVLRSSSAGVVAAAALLSRTSRWNPEAYG